MNEKFWIVWNPDGKNPTVRHTTALQAAREAERLAYKSPGLSFYVMEGTRVAKFVSPSVFTDLI